MTLVGTRGSGARKLSDYDVGVEPTGADTILKLPCHHVDTESSVKRSDSCQFQFGQGPPEPFELVGVAVPDLGRAEGPRDRELVRTAVQVSKTEVDDAGQPGTEVVDVPFREVAVYRGDWKVVSSKRTKLLANRGVGGSSPVSQFGMNLGQRVETRLPTEVGVHCRRLVLGPPPRPLAQPFRQWCHRHVQARQVAAPLTSLGCSFLGAGARTAGHVGRESVPAAVVAQ